MELGGYAMVTVVATLIVLGLMLVPVLNVLVGGLAWGLPGVIVGIVITVIWGIIARD
jgi:hypothetical protein